MNFAVLTLGCKVNQYEGRAMIEKLLTLGFKATDELMAADNYIINTCSVTSEADRKSRQIISKAQKLNSNAKIYICGCSSQNSTEEYKNKKNVRLIGGTGGKIKLLEKIIEDIKNPEKLTENTLSDTFFRLPSEYEDDLSSTLTKTRGYIKIQDGCNNFCSYCIVPSLRGRSRSRQIESIVLEAESEAEKTKEIVLTGINISAYGKDIGTGLTELIKQLGKINVRKRLGSLECGIINKEFVKIMLDNGFCNHFHLSMQSGSNSVLKRMNRHYSKEEFAAKVDIIRHISPHSGIMTDIITGFPMETEEEHCETAETLEKIKFSDIHIFPYSIRQGTKAAEMSPQIEKNIKLKRANELSQIRDKYKKEFLLSQIGLTANVYIEESDGEYNTGYTENYIKVYSKAPEKSLEKHLIKELYKEGVKGIADSQR